MPRLPRYAVPGLPQHVIQRGNDRRAMFVDAADYRFFRECLRAATAHRRCALHAYVLMPNHVHLLVTPSTRDGIGRVMQDVGRRYVPYFNRRHGRTGGLWEGRYRATLVESARYLLTCQRYIELNPVRAGLATRPGKYRWTSHHANAFGVPDPLVTPHELYRALGDDGTRRRAAYAALFASAIDGATLRAIRTAVHTGWALGGPRMHQQLAALGARRTRPHARAPRALLAALAIADEGAADETAVTSGPRVRPRAPVLPTGVRPRRLKLLAGSDPLPHRVPTGKPP